MKTKMTVRINMALFKQLKKRVIDKDLKIQVLIESLIKDWLQKK